MSYRDWLPPDTETLEAYLAETPKARKQRKALEDWREARIKAHRRMIRLIQTGQGEPPDTETKKPKTLASSWSAWS